RSVLARRPKRAAPERAFGMFGARQLRNRFQIAQPKTAKIRDMKPTLARDIAKRVAANIAIVGGVRHFADPDTIEHNPDDALESQDSNLACYPDFRRDR